jgi:methyl-accepting chemotaxis protein
MQLDQVIQENASASEEMASTAEELNSQSEQLLGAISFFKVNGNGDGGKQVRQLAAPAAKPAERTGGSEQGTRAQAQQQQAAPRREQQQSRSSSATETGIKLADAETDSGDGTDADFEEF